MSVEYTVSNLIEVILSDAEFRELAKYAEKSNIQFLCSPWDTQAVNFLESLSIPAYKIGSPDMTNFPLIERVIETQKPIFLSTGMSTEGEIKRTVNFLEDSGAEYVLLHCRSTYPAPFHNLNLAFMEKIMENYDVPVGYSGHERGIAVSAAAAAKGASIIERHFTLDRTMEGPDHAASLAPPGIKRLVRDIRKIEESQGTATRYMTRGEYSNRVSLAKSLATKESIRAGEKISREKITAKSPAKGISPQYLYDIVGQTAVTDIDSDTILQWENINKPEIKTYNTDLKNWGPVVRFTDITKHDWGEPDVFEFRINGADISADISNHLKGTSFQQRLGVHAPEQKGHDLIDLSARTEEDRTRSVDVLQTVIDLTRDVIAPHFNTETVPQIVIHPGGVTSERMILDETPELNEALEKSMNELDDDGVQLLLENMPPLPWIYGGQQYHNNFMDADEIKAYCERTGQRICYDMSHAKLWCNYSDSDLVQHAKKLEPYIDYLHIADAAGVDGEGLQIGDGEIDFERLVSVFSDFEGPIITEIWRGHENRGEGFKKAAERLSRYFG